MKILLVNGFRDDVKGNDSFAGYQELIYSVMSVSLMKQIVVHVGVAFGGHGNRVLRASTCQSG